jgi:hypothetical protein
MGDTYKLVSLQLLGKAMFDSSPSQRVYYDVNKRTW